MMKLLFRIIFIFILIKSNCYGQDTLSVKKQYEPIQFYTWGMPSFYEGEAGNCELELQRTYGFEFKVKAGCVVSEGAVRRWKRHNKRMDRIMQNRHGKDWRKKIEMDLQRCIKQHK